MITQPTGRAEAAWPVVFELEAGCGTTSQYVRSFGGQGVCNVRVRVSQPRFAEVALVAVSARSDAVVR
jgi:hypothetical protein